MVGLGKFVITLTWIRNIPLALHLVRMIIRLLVVPVLLISNGCAVHYFDAENNTEHIWGIGHMAMKWNAPVEGLKAVGHRTDVAGIATGSLEREVYLEVGWAARQQIEIVDENAQLCLAWPRGSFYNARIGSRFPPDLDDCGIPLSKEEKP